MSSRVSSRPEEEFVSHSLGVSIMQLDAFLSMRYDKESTEGKHQTFLRGDSDVLQRQPMNFSTLPKNHLALLLQ